MHVTKKQINKIIFQSCKLVALDFLIFVFLEFKLCARMYISLMKVASHVNYFYSVHITLFQSESSFKTARYQFEPNHKTVCKEDSPKPNKNQRLLRVYGKHTSTNRKQTATIKHRWNQTTGVCTFYRLWSWPDLSGLIGLQVRHGQL